MKKRTSVMSLKALFLLQAHLALGVFGHGRLMEPPNRSSLWRFKEFESLEPEKNYDDNQLWCGGMTSQYELSGGKCGPCGDEYLKSRPRENENGGRYGRGLIVRTYKPGQVIPIAAELTVNHLGYMVFNLCPIQRTPGSPTTTEEEECFDKYPLPLADGSGYKLPVKTKAVGFYNTSVVLPKDLTCKKCVIRWHYRTGNRWNPTKNETGELGAGDQEIFRGCSDVSIGSYPPDRTTVKPFHITKPSTTRPTTLKPSTTSSQRPSTTKPPMSTPRPHQFPTQRPPVTLPPTAKPVPTSSLPQSTTTRPKHPVMRPPGKVPPLAIMNQDSNAL